MRIPSASSECTVSRVFKWLRHQHHVGLQMGNFLQARINCAAHFLFVLRVSGIIAIIGIAHEPVLQSQVRKQFPSGSEPGKRCASPAGANVRCGRFRRLHREIPALDAWSAQTPARSMRREAPAKKLLPSTATAWQPNSRGGAMYDIQCDWCVSKFRFTPIQKRPAPKKNAPRDGGASQQRSFSRRARSLCGIGGWPGLRLESRLQWRDRGRFSRPSPLPMPAN